MAAPAAPAPDFSWVERREEIAREVDRYMVDVVHLAKHDTPEAARARAQTPALQYQLLYGALTEMERKWPGPDMPLAEATRKDALQSAMRRTRERTVLSHEQLLQDAAVQTALSWDLHYMKSYPNMYDRTWVSAFVRLMDVPGQGPCICADAHLTLLLRTHPDWTTLDALSRLMGALFKMHPIAPLNDASEPSVFLLLRRLPVEGVIAFGKFLHTPPIIQDIEPHRRLVRRFLQPHIGLQRAQQADLARGLVDKGLPLAVVQHAIAPFLCPPTPGQKPPPLLVPRPPKPAIE